MGMARDQSTSFPCSLSFASLVIDRKTPVAAGHVTTQNLGGKKSVGREGWQNVLIVAVTNFVGFKFSSSS